MAFGMHAWQFVEGHVLQHLQLFKHMLKTEDVSG